MAAHPRSRGENGIEITIDQEKAGSSPLTRGKHILRVLEGKAERLIPAHAGKTVVTCFTMSPLRALPRSRGENVWSLRQTRRCSGSSPLTRGKQRPSASTLEIQRLIPAHAGKTVTRARCCTIGPAHPRSRGENAPATTRIARPGGSSPLTRGKHFLTCAFTAQIDQILETLELAASFGSYLIWVACATDAPQDPVRSIGLVLPSSMGAS